MSKHIYLMTSRQIHSYGSHGHPLYYCKIGISNNPEVRLKQVQTGCPFRIYLDYSFEVDNPVTHENYWHRYFEEFCLSGEWFALDQAQISEFGQPYYVEDDVYAEPDTEWWEGEINQAVWHLQELGEM